MANIAEIFSFRNISEAIEAVKTGIPDRLPSQFNTVKEQVTGIETTYHTFYGMRKLVQRTEYAAPAKHVASQPVGQQPLILTSFKAFSLVQQELILRLRGINTLAMDEQKAKEFIAIKARDHKTRFENTRIAHKVQMLRQGQFWYDINGNLLPSASGAVTTVDFKVPAGNKGQAGIVTTSWADPNAPIMTDIERLKKKARQTTGKELKHVYYGLNIPGWIYANNSYAKYFQFNPVYFQAFSNDPTVIPNGFQGLTWHKMSDTFYEKEDGSIQQLWDDDICSFTPEIDKDVYTFFEGSELVPTSMGVQVGDDINTDNTEIVYGMHGYSVRTVDPVSIKLVLGDNSMPVWKNGPDLYILDVAP